MLPLHFNLSTIVGCGGILATYLNNTSRAHQVPAIGLVAKQESQAGEPRRRVTNIQL